MKQITHFQWEFKKNNQEKQFIENYFEKKTEEIHSKGKIVKKYKKTKMVVLEAGSQVVTVGNTQYLQPDYMSPVPSAVGFI